jgi:hypothetical protein
MMDRTFREHVDFDAVIIGAGPAWLAAAVLHEYVKPWWWFYVRRGTYTHVYSRILTYLTQRIV